MSEPVKAPAAEPTATAPAASAPAAEAAPAAAPVAAQQATPPAAQPQGDKPVVPEKYDLKLPEGSLLEPAYVEKISSYAKEKGLSNEQAQALLVREHEAVTSFAKAQESQWAQTTESWVNELKADKEIGGEKFAENAELAKRVLNRFGSEKLINELNRTQYGNHPELVRMMVQIGRTMAEDQLVLQNGKSANKRSIEDIFYGETKT